MTVKLQYFHVASLIKKNPNSSFLSSTYNPFRMRYSSYLLRVFYSGHTPFLHYLLVPSLEKKILEMQVTKTTLTLRSGWFWLPVFPILIFESWKPADNAKMVNCRNEPRTYVPNKNGIRSYSISILANRLQLDFI